MVSNYQKWETLYKVTWVCAAPTMTCQWTLFMPERTTRTRLQRPELHPVWLVFILVNSWVGYKLMMIFMDLRCIRTPTHKKKKTSKHQVDVEGSKKKKKTRKLWWTQRRQHRITTLPLLIKNDFLVSSLNLSMYPTHKNA